MRRHGALGVILEGGALVVVSHALEVASCLAKTTAEHESKKGCESPTISPEKGNCSLDTLAVDPQYHGAGQTLRS
jgi:hypothetical protein